MARTITELEVSDIDFKNNDMHSRLSILLPMTALMYSGRKPNEGEGQNEFHERLSKEALVTFLNSLDRIGYVISKKEEIPSAFTRGQ